MKQILAYLLLLILTCNTVSDIFKMPEDQVTVVEEDMEKEKAQIEKGLKKDEIAPAYFSFTRVFYSKASYYSHYCRFISSPDDEVILPPPDLA